MSRKKLVYVAFGGTTVSMRRDDWLVLRKRLVGCTTMRDQARVAVDFFQENGWEVPAGYETTVSS